MHTSAEMGGLGSASCPGLSPKVTLSGGEESEHECVCACVSQSELQGWLGQGMSACVLCVCELLWGARGLRSRVPGA